MNSNHLKPGETSSVCLSVPGTPSLMGARRNSIVQMSAKLAALRGENIREDPRKTAKKKEESDLNKPGGENSSTDGKNEDKEETKKNKPNAVRFMQKNGRCNIKQEAVGSHKRYLRDFFTTLVDMRWQNNLLFYVATYLIAWSFFGFLWYLIALVRGDIISYDDEENSNITRTAQGSNCVENVYSYPTAFLFYIETETSVGYGHRSITENCPEAIILFVIQALLGNILDAFMIGCVFIKISQPKNRATTLVFSDNCVISVRDRKYCLLFRVANLRNSLMVQCRIRAKLVKSRQTQEGEFIALHQDDINVGFDTGADNLFLVTPLIICHEIDEKSPFYSMSAEDIKREVFEIIVILEGMIESTGMICQARTSYLNDEVLWGYRFVPVLDALPKHYLVDHSSFNKSLEINMPEVSMKDFEEDIKQNGENSEFYKYVAPKMNNIIQRKDIVNRMRSADKNNSETFSIDDNKTVRSDIMNGSSFKINSTTKRTHSEINIGSIPQEQDKHIVTLNSDLVQRRQGRLSNRDDHYNTKRWSGDNSVNI